MRRLVPERLCLMLGSALVLAAVCLYVYDRQQKGWYQVEQAPASQIGTAYTRFSNQRPQ